MAAPLPGRERDQICLPDLASRQSSRRSRESEDEVCKKIKSSQIIGLELPRPGIGTFHKTPLSMLKRFGMSLPLATPLAFGPRNCGQLSAYASETHKTGTTVSAANRRI